MKRIVSLAVINLLLALSINAQSIEGIWVTTDDKSGEERSHMKLYIEDGYLKGEIVKLLQKEPSAVCTKCKGDRKDQPLIGLHILDNVVEKKGVYKGEILDPEEGKMYSCKITMLDDNKLKLRGYIGAPILGRTQYWKRKVD